MMRKDQIDAPAVNIELVTQMLIAHGRALDVPTGPAASPGAAPSRGFQIGWLPQHKVLSVLLIGRNIDSRTGDDFAAVPAPDGDDAADARATAKDLLVYLGAFTDTEVDDWDVSFTEGAEQGHIQNIAAAALIMARTEKDAMPKNAHVSAFIVPMDTPGVSVGSPDKKMGQAGSHIADVMLDDVHVPGDALLGGEPGQGFRFAMMGLDGGRLNIGACSLGGAQRCLDEAVAYTKDRQQFDTPIADFQNTQFMLADMATDLEAARALLYLAAAKVTDNAPDKSKFSAMAKRLATDSGSKVVNDALQLFGGYGYLKEYPIERFWRDLRVHSILEGTNQVMRMIVGREMLRQ